MSITTIYISIVLAVGRVLRSIVQNQVYAIMYTDLHDVTDLMLLCEGRPLCSTLDWPNPKRASWQEYSLLGSNVNSNWKKRCTGR